MVAREATTTTQGLVACAVVAVSAAATAAGLWYLFRRPCPHLSDLPPSAIIADGIQVVRQLTAEERLVIQESFLSGDDFRYIVAGKDYHNNKTMSAVNEPRHRAVTFGVVEYFIAFAERYGHVLVCRDRDDGAFLGAVGLIPPYRHHWLFTLHFYRTVIPYGKPAALDMGVEVAARFSAFSVMGRLHEECTKNVPHHWYVQVIGVSAQAQGRGVGTRLMNAAIALAGSTPMYLECHNDNVPYYERFDFAVKKKIEIVPKGISDTTTFEMNGMVRGGL